MELLQHLFVAPLIYFLGWFGNSRHGARRLTRQDEYRGNKRQTEWCELNCVFMEHYLPPWKVVIGINYQTGRNGDVSHDLAVSIVLASKKGKTVISLHARENRPGRQKLWHTVSKRSAYVSVVSSQKWAFYHLLSLKELQCLCLKAPAICQPAMRESVLLQDSWWGASIYGCTSPLFFHCERSLIASLSNRQSAL